MRYKTKSQTVGIIARQANILPVFTETGKNVPLSPQNLIHYLSIYSLILCDAFVECSLGGARTTESRFLPGLPMQIDFDRANKKIQQPARTAGEDDARRRTT